MRIRGFAPSTPCWVELTTSDPARAALFYGELFGWDVEGDHFLLDGHAVAGLSASRPDRPDGWLTYLAAPDLDGTIDRVRSAYGRLLTRPAERPGARGAIVADADGVMFGLWQANGFAGAQVRGEPGALAWSDLLTDDVATATAFYGTRYVMAKLDQSVVGLDTRASVTFSPTMTLEVYMQPFFAAGRYTDFEEYAAPRTSAVVVYGRDRGSINSVRDTSGAVTKYAIDPDGAGPARTFMVNNPDFSQRSLRGNAVFRWEYRPGSVLYVAWTQSRSSDAAFGDLNFRRDRSALLATRPDNIFLIKASWWLQR